MTPFKVIEVSHLLAVITATLLQVVNDSPIVNIQLMGHTGNGL